MYMFKIIHVYELDNNIKACRLGPVKAFRLECVPFSMNMIHMWGLHRDCQRQITGGLVMILIVSDYSS